MFFRVNSLLGKTDVQQKGLAEGQNGALETFKGASSLS